MLAGCVKESSLLRPYKGLLHRESTTLQDLAQEFKLHLRQPRWQGNLYCDPNKSYKKLLYKL